MRMTNPRHLRFTISTLLLVTVLVASYLARNPYQAFHPRKITTRCTADNNGISLIHMAFRRHKTDKTLDVVDFVVIERLSQPQNFQSLVRTVPSKYHPTAVFELPGRAINLPSDRQLLQLSDGEFTTSNVRIEPSVLSDFLSSYSTRSTIEQLAAMANPKKQAEP